MFMDVHDILWNGLRTIKSRKQRITFPMHFSKWGANLPAMIDRPQFMHSNISLATGGWVCPNMSTTYLLLASPLLLGSATLTRACADSLNSSSSSSKLRSRPNLAIRWHSDATSTIMESSRSPKKWDESCKQKPTKSRKLWEISRGRIYTHEQVSKFYHKKKPNKSLNHLYFRSLYETTLQYLGSYITLYSQTNKTIWVDTKTHVWIMMYLILLRRTKRPQQKNGK